MIVSTREWFGTVFTIMRLVFFIIFSCSETKLISPVISIIPHLFYFIVTSTHFKSEGKIGKVKIIQSPNEKKDFGDNLLTDKIVASPLHLRSYTWICFMAHLPVLFGRQRKHLQAANRNATMGCPPGNRLPTPSTPLAAIKKLGGALWAPPGAPGYTPLPITSIGCNDRIMKPVFVHAVQFYKLSLGL